MTALTNQTPRATPVPVDAGGQMASIVPQSVAEVFELAKMLSYAGDMVPTAFREKPEAIAAAIMRGMDIGLKPMQAVSQIAVINGKASVWGDALPAIMIRAGHDLEETLEGEGDGMIATCVLTRGDTGKITTRSFSVADAIQAELWSKKGPWQTYPKRMLSMRARGWAIRDGAADALMGLQVSEEVSDYAPPRDITPKAEPLSFAQRAAQMKSSEAEPAEEQAIDAKAEPVPDAEVATDPSPEFIAGAKANLDGFARDNCPHPADTQENTEWVAGWDSVPANDETTEKEPK